MRTKRNLCLMSTSLHLTLTPQATVAAGRTSSWSYAQVWPRTQSGRDLVRTGEAPGWLLDQAMGCARGPVMMSTGMLLKPMLAREHAGMAESLLFSSKLACGQLWPSNIWERRQWGCRSRLTRLCSSKSPWQQSIFPLSQNSHGSEERNNKEQTNE